MPKVVVIFYYIDAAGEFQIFTAREGAYLSDEAYSAIRNPPNLADLYKFFPQTVGQVDIDNLKLLADFASATNRVQSAVAGQEIYNAGPGGARVVAPMPGVNLDDFIRGNPAFPGILAKEYNVTFPTRGEPNRGNCRIYTESLCYKGNMPKFNKTFPKGNIEHNDPEWSIQAEVKEELNILLDHTKYIKIGRTVINDYVYAYQCDTNIERQLLLGTNAAGNIIRFNAELSFCQFESAASILDQFNPPAGSPDCQFLNFPGNTLLAQAFTMFQSTIMRTAGFARRISLRPAPNGLGLNDAQSITNARVAASSPGIVTCFQSINNAMQVANLPGVINAGRNKLITQNNIIGAPPGIGDAIINPADWPAAAVPAGVNLGNNIAVPLNVNNVDGDVYDPGVPPGGAVLAPNSMVNLPNIPLTIPAAPGAPERKSVSELINVPNFANLRLSAIKHRTESEIANKKHGLAPAAAPARAATVFAVTPTADAAAAAAAVAGAGIAAPPAGAPPAVPAAAITAFTAAVILAAPALGNPLTPANIALINQDVTDSWSRATRTYTFNALNPRPASGFYNATPVALSPAANAIRTPAAAAVPNTLISTYMLGGNFKEKYLKYKAKYLALKNNII